MTSVRCWPSHVPSLGRSPKAQVPLDVGPTKKGIASQVLEMYGTHRDLCRDTELHPSDLALKFMHGIALKFMHGSNDLPKSQS